MLPGGRDVRFRPKANIDESAVAVEAGAMTLNTNILALAVSTSVFAVCCVIMLRFGSQMNSQAFVYLFIAVWGLSALVWPFFAVRAVRAALAGR